LGTVVLAGGTGSAKLLRGLREISEDFAVISNVGDNFWSHGLYVTPDIDIAIYTLAGIADEVKGWGVRDDTFGTLEQLGRMGESTWFTLGDKDLATHIFRTEQLARGKRLGEITEMVCQKLGVKQRVFPSTDDRLETYIATREGAMHLQEFWVREKGRPEVLGVEYRGEDFARPERGALQAVEGAERIVFAPANPVSSIMPILAVRGLRDAVRKSGAKRVAVSPIIGGAPVSGPAGKMMAAIGAEPTSLNVARLYKGLVDYLLIDTADRAQAAEIGKVGMKAVEGKILMRTLADEVRLAEQVMGT
jgi:LPPG:FO 2-phospho-L-lactate transferase